MFPSWEKIKSIWDVYVLGDLMHANQAYKCIDRLLLVSACSQGYSNCFQKIVSYV